MLFEKLEKSLYSKIIKFIVIQHRLCCGETDYGALQSSLPKSSTKDFISSS